MLTNASLKNQQFIFGEESVKEYCPPDMNRHYHNVFEIYYITSGTCSYFVNNITYSLIPGDLILIPGGIIHNTRYRTMEHSRQLIYCSQRYIPASVRPLLSQMLYLYRNPNIAGEIKEIFEKIKDEYQRSDELRDDILCCYTHMLFFLLARNMEKRVEIKSERDYISRSIDYLQNNFHDEITLSQMAQMCSVTPVHFSRMFKKETGFGFSEYLNILRLQKAENLLLQTDNISISKVAEQCGFSDSNYFSSKFKKMYGTSPKAYIKKKKY